MLQEDELAILGDYSSSDNSGNIAESKATDTVAVNDVIDEYDEYEKQLMKEICGMETTGLKKENFEFKNAFKTEDY